MPFQIIRQDITKLSCDAIVNAANTSLLGGGGVDGAIHRAAGPQLLEECRTLGGCAVGEAKITGGYHLPAKYVIHTVGPIWRGGLFGEPKKLAACYRNALMLAKEKGCHSVAFPLISSGVYGYPKNKALLVAQQTITAFLAEQDEGDMEVSLVIFDRDAYQIGKKLYTDLKAYIDDHYVSEHRISRRNQAIEFCQERCPEEKPQPFFASEAAPMPSFAAKQVKAKMPEPEGMELSAAMEVPEEYPEWAKMPSPMVLSECAEAESPMEAPVGFGAVFQPAAMSMDTLEQMMQKLDESFAQMLLRKIDESGMTDAQCYKKANIDRKLFSKIRSNMQYKPSKSTVLAFAVALELTLDETKELLEKAGFALSHSSKFDVIVEYFIQNGRYDIYEINDALFTFDQNLLGSMG